MTVETRYMRNDYTLQPVQGETSGNVSINAYSGDVFIMQYFLIKVYKVSDDIETLIATSDVGSGNDNGLVSFSGSIPQTSMSPTDKIRIKVYADDFSPPTTLKATFTTPGLYAEKIINAAWAFFCYLKRIYLSEFTNYKFYFGNSTYDSRIENFTYEPFIFKPVKVRVEIFPEPGFFDDHFCKGWAKTSGGTSSVGLTGDLAVLNKGDQAECVYERAFSSLSTATYKKLICRVKFMSGQADVYLHVGGGVWYSFLQMTEPGVYEADISAAGNVDKIRLVTSGIAEFDYVAICKNSLFVPDLGDLVEELTVTRPVLSGGVAGAKFSIPNFNGEYNGYVKGHDGVIIWLARSEADLGNPEYKVFGGRVVAPTNRGVQYGEFYIDLDCHGHAYELNIPPALLQKYYAATNGRTIIEDALALCVYLTKSPLQNMWFDWSAMIGSTDDRIFSTHDCVYDEENPMTVIKEILEKAKNPAAIQGFDIYEAPSGVLVGHLRNSLDFISPVGSITPRSYQKSEDFHRIRNKIKVYGVFDDSAQMPKDENWTENLTNWATIAGTLSLIGYYEAGDYSIQCASALYGGYQTTYFYRTLQPELTIASGLKRTTKNSFGKIHFGWFTNASAIPFNGVHIELWAPDSSNYFVKYLSGSGGSLTFTLGSDGGWTSIGSPHWENIQKIALAVVSTDAAAFQTLIDNLRLQEGRFYGLAENLASQITYRARMSEPEIDDSLKTDAECQAKAESILAVLKDPVIALSDVVVDGDHRYNPGDRQRVVVSNDSLDAYSRILQVKYAVKGTQWDTVLTLSNEPQYLDYVFKLLQKAQKLLERRS